MREVFTPADPCIPPTDEIFYTIRREDVGKTTLPTTDVNIPFIQIGGRVLKNDVGKRVFGRRDHDGWHWSMESSKQRDQRTGALNGNAQPGGRGNYERTVLRGMGP